MRVVIAPDSFKGTLSADQAARQIALGVHDVDPGAECVEVPMSDGGEGFVDAVADVDQASRLTAHVHNQAGEPVDASFAVLDGTAYVDVASAVGLGLVVPELRDIMSASSRGVGELILAALDAGVDSLVVGLGGSGTNDGGAGMLAALGVAFTDLQGHPVDPTPERLGDVAGVDLTGLDKRLASTPVTIASDVTNPLLGEHGASAVFGPQKGATPDQVRLLDSRLAHLADAADRAGARRARELSGAGAAGGLGYGFLAFLQAGQQPGVQVVAEAVGLADHLVGADLAITGEGSVDAQTLSGKTPMGVAAVAADASVPVVLIAGQVADDADVVLQHGVAALVPSPRQTRPLGQVLARAAGDLRAAAATVTRIFLAGRTSAGVGEHSGTQSVGVSTGRDEAVLEKER